MRLCAMLLACLYVSAAHAAATAADQSAASPVAARKTGDTATHPRGKPSATTLPAVRVVGHYDNGIGMSDAASQGIVLGAMLQDMPLLRPGEVLETVPGMVVTQHSGDGKANQYFLRGYNLDHGTDFATSVDGVPVNMPTNAHGQGYTDLNFLMPELIQDIDYRKGTYTAQSGDFSAAGSADIHYVNQLAHPIADITGGSYDYRRLLLAGSAPLSATGGPVLLGAVELMKDDGPWRLPEDFHKFNLLLRLSDGDAARGWSMDAIGYDAHWNSTDQVPLPLIQSGALCRYCAMDPTDGGFTGRDVLSGEWHMSDGDGYVRASAYAEHYRLQLFSDFTFFELRPQTGDQFEQHESRNLLGTDLVKGWIGSLLGRDSTTELGLQIRHDDILVGLDNTEDRIPFQTVDYNRVDETEAGLYLQNSTRWNDWFRSVVGVREDRIFMDLNAYTLAANSGHAAQGRLSPKLSLIFGPWGKTEFFVDAGNGFHSNDARGVIYRYDPTTGLPADRVPALVGAFGREIGVRTQIVPGLQSSLSLWQLNSESELVYDQDSVIGSTEPNGASRRYGVEWSNHFVLNQWLLLDADYAWTHARYAQMNANGEAGDQIANAVPKVASLGLATHGLGRWSGEIKLRYLSRYPLSQDGALTGEGATVTNLRVERSLTPWAALSLDVLNVFDRKYYDIAYEQDYRTSLDSPVVPDGITVHPGEPREFRLTLHLTL